MTIYHEKQAWLMLSLFFVRVKLSLQYERRAVRKNEIIACKFHMRKTGKTTTDSFKKKSVEFCEEVVMAINSNPERYSGVYKEIAELLGDAAAIKVWKRFSGLNITFPQKLYSKEYTRRFISENMNSLTPHEIAKRVSLSERRVRQIISEIRDGKE
ncbi:Mor transcription activator family protein [Butyrivibrio sp. XPD2006]|uniref:Mor transcription activator family protein n=1 Tax=Butyrivibrio sp. XPD2006 TaxID=1280668 RepID=UPI0003B7B8E6|nr:Mor transcription activator family protein [Butyrivibrio sp. XPD2006]